MLAGLVSSEQCVKVLDVFGTSACSISLIATFTRLAKCALTHENTQDLDLAPLGVLPTLKHLLLAGQFQQLHCLAGLTRLECNGAIVSGVQEFAPNLQYLRADDSDLLGIHTQGLSSCTALTQLILNSAHLQLNNNKRFSPTALESETMYSAVRYDS